MGWASQGFLLGESYGLDSSRTRIWSEEMKNYDAEDYLIVCVCVCVGSSKYQIVNEFWVEASLGQAFIIGLSYGCWVTRIENALKGLTFQA